MLHVEESRGTDGEEWCEQAAGCRVFGRRLLHQLGQWYSTWGTRIPGGTRRHLRGYVKLKEINILLYDKR
jgi:hypothetical protein